QKDLNEFLERQQLQARISERVHSFTAMCWDKCITGTPSTRFARGEESCLTNCVDRFMDTSLFMVNQIDQQQKAATLTQ
ncbi:hypothetical protein SISNIDRAFT_408298, partial [Sistotremastrum niveocremeum HHB9708]